MPVSVFNSEGCIFILIVGAVAAFGKKHLLLRETKVTVYGKPSTARRYFRSIWTALYQLWEHLIWAPKLGKSEKKIFSESKQLFCVNMFLFSIPKKCTTLTLMKR